MPVDKNQSVSNPLTIVAIFAALAEVAGTTAIGLIREDLQSIFIWFVMLFPVLLVALFFFILFFKPTVFYAPSDFKDEKNFMALIQESLDKANESLLDKANKIAAEREKFLNQTISVKLVSNEEEKELPLGLRRADVIRLEVLGRIGMMPMKEKGSRFSLKYLSTLDFLNQLNQVKEDPNISTITIHCDAEEFSQFDWQELKSRENP